MVGIWNYATADPQHLVLFAFLLYDTTGEGKMSKEEFTNFVEEVYHGSAKSMTVDKMWKHFDTDHNHSIELLEFRDGCGKRQNLLWPAFQIQSKLREKIFGTKWWFLETERRMSSPELANLHIHEILIASEERFGKPKAEKLAKAQAMKKRHEEIDKAKRMEHHARSRFDSHNCIEDDIAKEIQNQVDQHDTELQREIYRKKHGFSPSRHVFRVKKRFKKRRREHHLRRKLKKNHNDYDVRSI